MIIECPNCHNVTFKIHSPPPKLEPKEGGSREIVKKGDRYFYFICLKCGKLLRLNKIEINDGYLSRGEISE
jgi:hypothetical protein